MRRDAATRRTDIVFCVVAGERTGRSSAGKPERIDVLINNASDLGPTPLALQGDTDCEYLERAFATNVLGPFRLTNAVLGALSASAREGR